MKTALANRQTALQFVKFCVVGVMNTVITLAVIYVLSEIYAVNYTLANLAGYLVGLLNSFIWNKVWTFQAEGDTRAQAARFLVTFAVSYVIQLGALIGMRELLGLSNLIAQGLSMGVFTVVNFVINKVFTFRA